MDLNRCLLCLCVIAAVFLCGQRDAAAKRYLTSSEAQKICFPGADKFSEENIRLSPQQIEEIHKKTGVKFQKTSNKVWVAQQGTNFLGVLILDIVIGKHEFIDYVVALSPEGKILQVEILEYRESHGGDIRKEKWRAQFKGKNASNALRLNDDIYNITGATMSCRHVSEGIRRVLATYEMVLRPRLISSGRMPDPSGR